MKHTEEQIVTLIKSLMQDLNREYYSTIPMKISFKANLSYPFFDQPLANAWVARVPVRDDQFHKTEPDYIVIIVNDDTTEIESYLDGSSGRPVPLRAKKNSPTGKYRLELK